MHCIDRINPGSSLQSTFPDNPHTPPKLYEGVCRPDIVIHVTPDLGPPELIAGSGPFKEMAIMLMPEATIHKHDRPITREDEVRLSGQVLTVQPIAKTRGV